MKNSILVIDDSEEMLEVRKMLLEMEGYDVLTAGNSADAFKILTEKTPNLILLDYKMREMNGDDFLIELDQRNPRVVRDVPIVFYTGMVDVPATKASGFISKMTPIPEFLNQIATFMVQPIRLACL